MGNSRAIPPLVRPGLRPDEFHPLEVIGWFRRWRPSPARDIVYTFIWNTLLGLLFFLAAVSFRPSVLNWTNFFFNLMIVQIIGYSVHATFLLTDATGLCRLGRRGGFVAVLYYTCVCTLGVFAGYMIVAWAFDWRWFSWVASPRAIGMIGMSSFLISVIIASIFFARERQARAEAELGTERLRAERIEREATAANLRALQAQIEPHFLFNTLANVSSLIDLDTAKAKRMLESFNRFLRSSLAATRQERTTLAAESELICAYLDVLQVRMGPRLRYHVAFPADLAGFELPPMLLQPVVENAIQHGLEPKVEGGEVHVAARREAGAVLVEVRDTGIGFGATTRGGLGLTNLRERLQALYGDRGALSIADNAGGGAVVTLRLPA
jgi:signal transduction histidine kinase